MEAPKRHRDPAAAEQLTSLLLYEAEVQCRYALIGADLLAQADQMPSRPGSHRHDYFWFAVQAILIAGGNLKNIFFTSIAGSDPQAEQRRVAQKEKREPMRRAVQLDESSCLARSNVRNALEHFDDRIVKWYRKTKTGNITVRAVTKGGGHTFPTDTQPLGHFDRDTGDVTFWADGKNKTDNVYAIVTECRRILPLIGAEIERLTQGMMRRRYEEKVRQFELDPHGRPLGPTG